MRAIVRSIGMILIGCCLAVAAYGSLTSKDPAEEKIDFSLKDLDGGEVTLDGLLSDHKVILLNFTATWCPYCKDCVPHLIALENEHGQKGFAVVSVYINDQKNKVAAYAKKMNLNYQILLDPEGQVAKNYGVVGIPANILIGRAGNKLGTYSRVTRDLEKKIEVEVRRLTI